MRISDWSSDVCSSDLAVRPAPARIADIIDALEDHDMRNARQGQDVAIEAFHGAWPGAARNDPIARNRLRHDDMGLACPCQPATEDIDRKSTRLNSSH